MNTYLIKLKPVQFFFFGTEKRSELGNRSNYFQKSGLYPQQTTLLGLLRYLILKQENKLNTDISVEPNIEKLIGAKSFEFNDIAPDFGKLNKIYPVFIIDNEERHYHTLPMEHNYNLEKVNGKVKNGFVKKQSPIFYLDGYTEKKEIESKLINKEQNIIIPEIKENDIGVFSYFIKAGNQKKPDRYLKNEDRENEAKRKEAKLEAYYKQEFAFMDSKYSFAFYVESDYEFDESTFQVTLGKEKSLFTISFKKLNVEGEKKEIIKEAKPFIKNKNYNSITLISNTFVEESIFEKTIFAVTKILEFRNIISKVKTTKKYNNLLRNNKIDGTEELRISNKLELIKKGSVLFFNTKDDTEAAAKLIEKHKNFRKIGYNYFYKNIKQEEK